MCAWVSTCAPARRHRCSLNECSSAPPLPPQAPGRSVSVYPGHVGQIRASRRFEVVLAVCASIRCRGQTAEIAADSRPVAVPRQALARKSVEKASSFCASRAASRSRAGSIETGRRGSSAASMSWSLLRPTPPRRRMGRGIVAVPHLALHVVHNAFSEDCHPRQVLLERIVDEPKESLPALGVTGRSHYASAAAVTTLLKSASSRRFGDCEIATATEAFARAEGESCDESRPLERAGDRGRTGDVQLGKLSGPLWGKGFSAAVAETGFNAIRPRRPGTRRFRRSPAAMEPAAAAVAGPGGFRNSAALFLDAVDENSTHAVAHLAQDPSALPRYDRGPLPESLGDDEPEARSTSAP